MGVSTSAFVASTSTPARWLLCIPKYRRFYTATVVFGTDGFLFLQHLRLPRLACAHVCVVRFCDRNPAKFSPAHRIWDLGFPSIHSVLLRWLSSLDDNFSNRFPSQTLQKSQNSTETRGIQLGHACCKNRSGNQFFRCQLRCGLALL